MPPRNSRTKAFRKYNYVKSPDAVSIPMEKIYNTILKPEDSIGNSIYKQFEEYKNERAAKGMNLTAPIDRMIKSDEDGDPRYINKQWYKNRAKGYPDDYKPK
jgi:hypothetical protein